MIVNNAFTLLIIYSQSITASSINEIIDILVKKDPATFSSSIVVIKSGRNDKILKCKGCSEYSILVFISSVI